MKKNPITFFAEKEVKDKLDEKLKATGMTKEEYLSWLIENDCQEEEEEEFVENDSLEGIVDVTEKEDLIANLKEINLDLEERLTELEEYPVLNKLFSVVKGHTLNIKGYDKNYEIETKADFLRCLVYNFYAGFDPDDFGLDDDWEDDYNDDKGEFEDDDE